MLKKHGRLCKRLVNAYVQFGNFENEYLQNQGPNEKISNTKVIEKPKIYHHVKFEDDRKNFVKKIIFYFFKKIKKFSKKNFKKFEKITKNHKKIKENYGVIFIPLI